MNTTAMNFTQEEVKNLSIDDFKFIYEGTKLKKFKTTPMKHQYAAVTWALARREVMYLMGIGTGKTYSALLTSQVWGCKKILIICPNSVRQTWKDEIEKHTQNTYTELTGATKERKKLFKKSKTDYYIINYEGLKLMWGKKTPTGKKTRTGKPEIVWGPDIASIERSGFDCIIVDECFPYSEPVLTNKGILPIGLVVEQQLPVKVLSFNYKDKKLEWKNVIKYYKKPLVGGLLKIKCDKSEIVCTPNHKISVNGEYVRADNLKIGDKIDSLGVDFEYNLIENSNYKNYMLSKVWCFFKNLLQKTKEDRLEETASLSCSRICSIEILESGSGQELRDGAQQNQIVYNLEVEDNHNYFVNGLLVSNCHHCRNFYTCQTKIAYELANVASNIIGLTGTPFDKELTDFWGEFMVLDGGETLGSSWWKFLKDYFKTYQIEVMPGIFIDQHKIIPAKKEELLSKVGEKILRYETSECTDLPKTTYQTRYVWMSSDQEEVYDKIVNDLVVKMNNGELTLSNVMNKSIKLRQVVSGFVLGEDKKPSWFNKNPKLDELIDLLYETGKSKVVVFHHFVEEGRIIEKMLSKKGIKYASMRGEIKDKQKEYQRFRDNPDVKVMIAHPQTGGEGLNLQMANVIIFFSQIGGGGISRPQAEGRIIRAGQDKPCVIIDLLCGSGHQYETVEERLCRASKLNVDFSESVLDWLKNCNNMKI